MSRRNAWERYLAPGASPTTERQLQEACEQWLALLVARHQVMAYFHRPDLAPRRSEQRGLPDLVIALRPGVVVAVELKVGARKTTPDQDVWLEAFGDQGAVCRTLAEFQAALRAWGAG